MGVLEAERLDEQRRPYNQYGRATASMFSRRQGDVESRSEGGNKPKGVLLTLCTPKEQGKRKFCSDYRELGVVTAAASLMDPRTSDNAQRGGSWM